MLALMPNHVALLSGTLYRVCYNTPLGVLCDS
nr:MAG TPA: hypothetical protein [Caudoviricetes sp.]